MPKSNPPAKTDAELLRQMDEAAAGQSPVEAVVRLRPDDPAQIIPSPERTEELTRQLLERVKNRVGSSEIRYHVFPNLGSFVVAAEPSFLRELLLQPEAAAVMANQQPGDPLIQPVKQAPVSFVRSQRASRSPKKVKPHSTARKSAGGKSGK